MKNLITILILAMTNLYHAQQYEFYTDSDGNKELWGTYPLSVLETDSTYAKWYKWSYDSYYLENPDVDWKKNLKDVKVEIFMGTWCGDSRNYVPKFVHLWKDLGLNENQLTFVALSSEKGDYKQGLNGEDDGKFIHRVPTFIFTRNGKEIARIVEEPANSLETDVAQIALGFPSVPNHQGATRMMQILSTNDASEVKNNKEYLEEIKSLVSNPWELNTLGRVYFDDEQIENAITTNYYNIQFFKDEPKLYANYAAALQASGDKDGAIDNYEKALLLDRSNTKAKKGLRELKSE